VRDAVAVIRPATPADEPALRALDRRVWSWLHAPVEPRDRPFDTEGVLVCVLDGELAGYVKLGRLWPDVSVAHVREIKGLAVDTRFQRRGLGRALVAAAIERARAEGARKLTLRVLGHNAPARRLYAACGFEVEGVLHDLFLLEGRYVDDVLMSLDIQFRD
jgi:ribosomal protein S18 acetylase RimI-like enzyme